jgi:AcrR family transcriptional regulator
MAIDKSKNKSKSKSESKSEIISESIIESINETLRKKGPFDKRKLTPGGSKIVNAFLLLLRKQEFASITTAKIAEASGVNEALIYRYFGSKRELLHSVLLYFLLDYFGDLTLKLRGIKGSLNKLRKIIWENVYMYQHDLVFAKILILEVRNYPGYFQSETYKAVKKYVKFIREIIEEGVREGEIRNDVSSWVVMQIILAGIEHLSMAALLNHKNLATDESIEDFCNILFKGIKKN